MRRGLSQAELARRLGLTDRTVHRYETVGAPTRMGFKLSETLGFPDRFFERRPCVEFDAKAISFRARRTTTKRQRAAAISAGSFGIEVDLWISQRFGLPDVAASVDAFSLWHG